MKAEIKEATWIKEFDSKFGKLQSHKIVFIDENLNEITAQYASKKKEQTQFKAGEEAEFTLEEMTGPKGKYYKVRPIFQGGGNQNYAREKKREQSRYSGFAVSYAKDLVIAGKLEYSEFDRASEKIFWLMVNLDKKLES